MKLATLTCVLIAVVAGCAHRTDRVHTRDRRTVTVRETVVETRTPDEALVTAKTESLADLSQDVVNAPSRNAQAAALRRLWEYMRENNYTYQINATRLSNGQRVDSPATADFPVQVNMAIYQADRKLHEFTFQPLDNSDIAFMTAGGT